MSSIDSIEVGKRIKNIRLSLSNPKLTMEEFGKLITPEADKAAVSKWEKGAYLPNSERLVQIANLGNVTTDFILFGKELNGHGKRIEKIRKDLSFTEEDFTVFFKPPVSEETIKSWEKENSLPSLKQLEVIADLGKITYEELLFGIKRKVKTPYSTLENLNKVERNLEKQNISFEEALKSDHYFTNMNNLRLIQKKNPDSFDYLYEISRELTEVVDHNLTIDYEVLNEKVDLLKNLIEEFCKYYFEESRS